MRARGNDRDSKTPIKTLVNSNLFKLEKTEQKYGFYASSAKPSLEGNIEAESKVLSYSLYISEANLPDYM